MQLKRNQPQKETVLAKMMAEVFPKPHARTDLLIFLVATRGSGLRLFVTYRDQCFPVRYITMVVLGYAGPWLGKYLVS